MGKLKFYAELDEKKEYFSTYLPESKYYKIDYANEFINWYDGISNNLNNNFSTFFRGVSEAKYKLYNSAQRFWIQNNLMQLESLTQPVSYLDMIQNMVEKAKEVRLLNQVLEYYNLTLEQMDIPILSILQHYNAPTPLMDWTYDLNIALFFAITNIKKSDKEGVIEDYISIYQLNRETHSTFMQKNLNEISANVFPSIKGLGNYLKNDKVIYISDFEVQGSEELKNKKIQPTTTYYNLNILAQKGLFVFNPSEDRPLEEFPQLHDNGNINNRIICYNINKDLSELIKYKIGKQGIISEFLFPNLEQYSRKILEDYLQYVVG